MRPRDWLVNPDQFGQTKKAAWKPATEFLSNAERATRSAAYLQHNFCCEVAERIREDTTTVAAVARRAELDAGTFGHALRGRHSMTLAIMIGVSVAMGHIDLLPVVNSFDGLEP